MQKKLMAVAVAGALAAPGVVLAQASTVQIGGGLTAFYYKASNHNPSVAKNADIMESSEPEMYVRGEENLGGGLSAWFQCTSSFDAFITGASSAFGMCARNSGMGFKGSWGNTWWGNWDTPHKLVTNRARGWFGGTNAFTGGVGNLGLAGSASGTQNPTTSNNASPAVGAATGTATTTTNNPASFFRRQASSWFYHSPSWNGFQVQGSFSAANESTGIPQASVLKPRMLSLAAHWDSGPIYVGVGYEKHSDYNASNQSVGATGYTGGTDDNWVLAAAYTFANQLKLSGLYTRSNYDVNATMETKTKAWWLFMDWALSGPHSIKAQYGTVNDAKGTSTRTIGAIRGPAAATCGITGAVSCASDTGAKQYGIFYNYAFSKRTSVFVGMNHISNDTNGVYSLGKVTPTVGNSQTNTGVGMKHSF